ncbi:MAG: exodeoxyribonuclease V subunit alpha [Ardenticatenia bacterium]|nr:exodeoxyribonuclease V subunit alpha [Ardenticatenia bacterium]
MKAGDEATVAALQAAATDWLAPQEVHIARLLGDLAPRPEWPADDRVRLALALAARQVRLGHVCLDLPALCAAGGPVDEEGRRLEGLVWPPLAAWLAALGDSPLVTCLPEGSPPEAAPAEPRPLVLEQPAARLYLRRWWEHEARLAAVLAERAAAAADHDPQLLAAGLQRYFAPPAAADAARREGVADQAAAAALALRRRLAVISGGPGTGKTSTVLRILALLAEQAAARDDRPPRVLLLAPTGKAAARMQEAVAGGLEGLPADEALRRSIKPEARTLHRALGMRQGGGWRHGPADPLPADVVVVDEASMIDAALMRALAEAVAPDARLVILGDRDQLTSVEAGAVLAEICGPPTRAGDRRSSAPADPAAAPDPEAPPPAIAACIARLSYSFRFTAGGGIGDLAVAVRDGDADRALTILRDPDRADLRWLASPPTRGRDRLEAALEQQVLEGYGVYLDALRGAAGPAGPAAIAEALRALGSYRLLCAHRRGPAGVAALNEAVTATLARAGRLEPIGEQWPGRALLITRNDEALRLYNGDTGLVAVDAAADGRLRAWFPGLDGKPPRAIAPPRLPPHENALVMSIHKSQGSEFDRVAVILPDADSPLLSRELLYTAITRARQGVTVYAGEAALRAAIGRRARRDSGLGARLWGGARRDG